MEEHCVSKDQLMFDNANKLTTFLKLTYNQFVILGPNSLGNLMTLYGHVYVSYSIIKCGKYTLFFYVVLRFG